MKRLTSLLVALALCLGCVPAFASWSQTNTLNYSTDTGVQGVTKLDAEFELVYTHLNNLNALSAAGSAPSSPDTNDIYLDIADTANPQILQYTGSAWRSVQPPTEQLFHVRRTDNAEAVQTGIEEQILFDSEILDYDSIYVAATGRVTPTRAGIFELVATVGYPATPTNLRVIIKKNGTAISTVTYGCSSQSDVCTAHGPPIYATANGTTDYFTVSVYADASANLQSDNTYMTAFWGRWIGRSE